MKLRPCNLKSNSGFLGKQSAGQKDDAEQDVKTVVHLAQLQRSHVTHFLGTSTKG
jgi:hypothetical protein